MTLDHYQTVIAAKIKALKAEKEGLENLDIDLNDPLSIQIENRLKAVEKGLHDIETIAFFIISQEDELTRLREENYTLSQRVNVLRQQNERLYIRANAAQSVSELHKAKWDKLEREAEMTLREMLNAPEFQNELNEPVLI
jgi:hypothetical protein